MDSNRPLRLSYSGSLKYYSEKEREVDNSLFSSLFRTYHPDVINHFSRSGDMIFKAINHLQKTVNISSKDFLFKLWGNIESGNGRQVESLGIEELVSIGGMISKEESNAELEQSDVLFLALEFSKDGQKPLFIPGKIFDYIELKKPIFAIADDSDAKEILENSGLALISDNSIVDISKNLLYLIENKRKLKELFSPNEDYIMGLDSKHKTKDLTNLFDKILKSK